MRAGSLDRVITLQSATSTVDDNGTPSQNWADFADCRAQLVQASTTEFLRDYGFTETIVVVFRIRWLDGVTEDMRVSYDGKSYTMVQITEIGRRIGLELRCQLVRAEAS